MNLLKEYVIKLYGVILKDVYEKEVLSTNIVKCKMYDINRLFINQQMT